MYKMYANFRESKVDTSKSSLKYGLKYGHKRVLDPYQHLF